MSDTNLEQNGKPKNRIISMGQLLWFLTFSCVAGLAALLTNLDDIRDFFTYDASISVTKAEVLGNPTAIDVSFDGKDAKPAVQFSVEYVEVIAGKSPIINCRSQLSLARKNYNSLLATGTKQNSQEVKVETFVVEKENYSGQASLLRICDGRIGGPITFSLPAITSATPVAPTIPLEPIAQNTSYVVCLGEKSQACGGGATWLPCNSDYKSWAKSTYPDQCKSITSEAVLSDVGGNACGYATIQITCSNL